MASTGTVRTPQTPRGRPPPLSHAPASTDIGHIKHPAFIKKKQKERNEKPSNKSNANCFLLPHRTAFSALHVVRKR